MLISTTLYASSVNCIKSDKMFEEQDRILRRAARIAIHAAPDVRNAYINKHCRLLPSKERTLQQAKNYVVNERRSPSIKQKVGDIKKEDSSPLSKIIGAK